jgi:hypothetical protein
MTGIFGIESKFIAPMTTRPNAVPNNWSMGTPLSYGKRRATSQPSNPIVTNERANAASSDHRAGHGTYFVARASFLPDRLGMTFGNWREVCLSFIGPAFAKTGKSSNRRRRIEAANQFVR